MAKVAKHAFSFFRAGGVDQVRLATAADLCNLDQLDQKLWVALSCPVKGLSFDEKTLALIDADGDGRVRASELIGAVKWIKGLLKDPSTLVEGQDAIDLENLDESTDEGKLLATTARSLLAAIGRGEDEAIGLADLTERMDALASQLENGDGLVPVARLDGDADRAVGADILSTSQDEKLDRSGERGIDAELLARFETELSAYLEWCEKGRDPAVRILGEDTAAKLDAFETLLPKLRDYFVRARAVRFDPRLEEALNAAPDQLAALRTKALDAASVELLELPVARIGATPTLALGEAGNPAYRNALAGFARDVAGPLLGLDGVLSEAHLAQLEEKAAPYFAWKAAKPATTVEPLGEERLRAIRESGALERIATAITRDKDSEARWHAIGTLEKLVRLHRDLFSLANNFVSFRDFYSRERPATFQSGTLYIDQRAAELCLTVTEPARHATLAHLSGAYLLYCDAKRHPGKAMTIVAAITDGDVDNLMVGRNGVFYDRDGNDWDATVTRIVDNPISVRQAFWSPYKKLLRLIEDQVNRRANQAREEADAKIAEQATHVDSATKGEVKPIAPPPKKLDIGVVAALGVAVGGITAALGALLGAFFGLGLWMPLGIVGLMLVISGPSMAVAWLKLNKRNLGPLLDANGWAINVQARVNAPLGRSLTSVARLPLGASRNLVDPFAVKKRPVWRYALTVVLAALGVAWFLGKLDRFVPEKFQSTTVLGSAAPALVQAPPSASAAPAASSPPSP